MMPTIQIDFDVWREIIYRRMSEADSESAVLRRLLFPKVIQELLSEPTSPGPVKRLNPGRHWRKDDVELPDGTELVLSYKGQVYTALLIDGEFVINDNRVFTTPSSAATAAVGGYNINGWEYWSVKRPGIDDHFVRLEKLRTIRPTRPARRR